MVGLFFYFIFFAVLVFSGACPLRVVVFCACARGWWPCLCGGLLPGWMLCGVAVRAMEGRSWLLAVMVSFSFPGRLLCRLLCGC